MSGALLGGNADPLQADDEEDLREREVRDGQLLAELGASLVHGGLCVPHGQAHRPRSIAKSFQGSTVPGFYGSWGHRNRESYRPVASAASRLAAIVSMICGSLSSPSIERYTYGGDPMTEALTTFPLTRTSW